MSEYTVIYQFLCPNCKHFGVGNMSSMPRGQQKRRIRFQLLPCPVKFVIVPF